MPIRLQPGFFDICERTVKLTEMGDPLVTLKGLIDWEAFRPCLNVVYEKHYGYKNHINADETNKLAQNYAVSDAAVHDSQVFDELLDQTVDADGKKRRIYADSAYRSKEREETLAGNGFESQIHEKGARNHPLTDEQKASNRIKSNTRARVEHVFGAQHAMGGHVIRAIGIAWARAKIGMMNLVYNMRRLVQLVKRDAIKAIPQLDSTRIVASLAA